MRALPRSETLNQMLRFAAVGITVNLLGYLVYLLVTWLFLSPKVAVSVFYPLAALAGYFGQAKLAFAYEGETLSGMMRYFLAHLIGYLTNIALLYVFVDRLGYPHQAVQAVAIFVVGGILFVLMRYFVFRRVQTNN